MVISSLVEVQIGCINNPSPVNLTSHIIKETQGINKDKTWQSNKYPSNAVKKQDYTSFIELLNQYLSGVTTEPSKPFTQKQLGLFFDINGPFPEVGAAVNSAYKQTGEELGTFINTRC